MPTHAGAPPARTRRVAVPRAQLKAVPVEGELSESAIRAIKERERGPRCRTFHYDDRDQARVGDRILFRVAPPLRPPSLEGDRNPTSESGSTPSEARARVSRPSS